MKLRLSIAVLLLTFIHHVGFAQTTSWQDLKPLLSTKSDADQLGGEVEVSKNGSVIKYKLNSMSVEIELETVGFCSAAGGQYNVAKDTIIAVAVDFYDPRNFSDLGIDRSTLQEHRIDNDTPDLFVLSHIKNGLVLQVEERGEAKLLLVGGLRQEPTEDQQVLRCPKTETQP